MSNGHKIVCHVLCWTAFLIYTYFFWLNGTPDKETIYWAVSINLARIITFYFCFSWMYPKFSANKNRLYLILGIPAAYLLFACCRYSLDEWLYVESMGFRNYNEGTPFWYYVIDNAYYATPYIVLSAAIFFLSNYFESERKNHNLSQGMIQAELAFLRTQINPHYLYNALNYLYASALKKSESLPESILKLADSMKYTLRQNPDGLVNLQEEINYIQLYLSLVGERFTPDFHVQFQVDMEEGNPKIAPLLFIPLVENALKHGVVDCPTHPVRILAQLRNNLLLFEVNNKKGGYQKDFSHGIGLENVKRRLELLYGNRQKLRISEDAENYFVCLQIDLNEFYV